jgi:hypothetical protein
VNEARANACEITAWRFLTHPSEREAVEFCLYEIPDPDDRSTADSRTPRDEENGLEQRTPTESTALLTRAWSAPVDTAKAAVGQLTGSRRYQLFESISKLTNMTLVEDDDAEEEEEDPTKPFVNLNALEIAAIADAKRFLSQAVVQKIVTGVWRGDIIFWDKLSVDAEKKPRFYNPRTADAFSRLRVPKYLKAYEVVWFAVFLVLYYSVLVERNPYKISFIEVLLYIWFAAFCYDELSEWIDAGSVFYATDVWNIFDLIMIVIGVVFAIMRMIGLTNNDNHLVDMSFDVLSLEALFMVPRICSILSLSPYWGTLIPCLKEMGKDFVKFMVLVIIVYLGFLTTFSLVGRDAFSLSQMTMILTKIFFGSSYVGFDIMDEIDEVFGPPLMLIFVTLSSILLMGSLTGMLSNSFSRVISHAREEYNFVYSVYVLEASTSNRLTHFYPPFNLLALVIFRPLRLFLPSDNKFRGARIVLLKATHLPIVGAIRLFELIRGSVVYTDDFAGFSGPPRTGSSGTPKKPAAARPPMASRPSGASWRNSPRPVSASDLIPRLQRAGEDTDVDAPSDTDVRIAELSVKIDKLTELVLRMHAQQDSK